MQLRSLLHRTILLSFLALFPASAFATGSITLNPSGDGKWVLAAAGLNNVGGLEINISYDTTTLSSPVVSNGPLVFNAMPQQNTSRPGVIRIGVISSSALPTGGVIANISFTRSGDSPGAITGISASAWDATRNIAKVVVTAGYNNPTGSSTASGTPTGDNSGTTGSGNGNTDGSTASNGGGTSGTTGGTSTNTGTTGGGTTYGSAVAGTITLPSDPLSSTESSGQRTQAAEEQVTAQTQPVQEQPGGEEVAPPAPASESQQVTRQPDEKPAQRAAVQTVLERFRLYQGEATAAKLIALFDSAGQGAGFTQEPPIALSDGVSTVKVTVTGVPGDRAPNFAFQGARYVSMTQVAAGTWVVEARPAKDAAIASVSMFADGQMHEYPLTVAPKAKVELIKAGSVTPADFELFLKDRGTPKAPKYDLNGDGRRDYQDDYIFTANYLAVRQGNVADTAEKKAPEQKKTQTAK